MQANTIKAREYARPVVATMRFSVPELRGARRYALLRAQLFKKCSF
jgi:hypothetical protein